MKLKHLLTEAAIVELRDVLSEALLESVTDYLATTTAMLKNGKQVDLEKLAIIITALQVFGKSDFRQSMTRDDIGINPNDFKQLYLVLNSITRDGKNLPKLTDEVLTAIKSVAPSLYKKNLSDLKSYESGSKSQQAEIAKKVTAFMMKANQMFYKIKSSVK